MICGLANLAPICIELFCLPSNVKSENADSNSASVPISPMPILYGLSIDKLFSLVAFLINRLT
jgi:hypothetical protein